MNYMNYTVMFFVVVFLCIGEISSEREIRAAERELLLTMQQSNDLDSRLFSWYTVYSKYSKEKITPMSKVLEKYHGSIHKEK